MRTISKSQHHFHGTHKGCDVSIERERDPDVSGAFYIIVTHSDGGHLYDDWSPPDVLTMAEAKREALYGSGLKEQPLRRFNSAAPSPQTPQEKEP